MRHQLKEAFHNVLTKIVGGEDHRETQYQSEQRRVEERTAHNARHVCRFRMLVGHMYPCRV